MSLSANGNIAFVGGPGDGSLGAVWVFGRTGGAWMLLDPAAVLLLLAATRAGPLSSAAAGAPQ